MEDRGRVGIAPFETAHLGARRIKSLRELSHREEVVVAVADAGAGAGENDLVAVLAGASGAVAQQLGSLVGPVRGGDQDPLLAGRQETIEPRGQRPLHMRTSGLELDCRGDREHDLRGRRQYARVLAQAKMREQLDGLLKLEHAHTVDRRVVANDAALDECPLQRRHRTSTEVGGSNVLGSAVGVERLGPVQ